MRRLRAVGLISGGLDSYLAARLMKELGVEVVLAHAWIRGMYPVPSNGHPVVEIARALELPLVIMDLADGYIHILENPKYGYGKGVNPCIDCKAYFLREARKLMYTVNAEFVFTGEVLGQRPKSQRTRKILELIERESGLVDRLLRPLSAKLLRPTLLERMGVLPRDRLLAISGRSRKAQLLLASNYRFDAYSPPGGGCILTSEEYAKRFRALRKLKGRALEPEDWALLRSGKVYDLGEAIGIVPRNAAERGFLSSLSLGWGVKLRDERGNLLGVLMISDGTEEQPLKYLETLLSLIYGVRRFGDEVIKVVLEGPEGEKVAMLRVSDISKERAHELLIK